MACTYKDLSSNNTNSLTHKHPLTPRDVQFLNVLYFLPVGLQMDKGLIHHFLTKAKLVCQWLKGILKFTDKLDRANSNKEGK